jgi:hypothetical protein
MRKGDAVMNTKWLLLGAIFVGAALAFPAIAGEDAEQREEAVERRDDEDKGEEGEVGESGRPHRGEGDRGSFGRRRRRDGESGEKPGPRRPKDGEGEGPGAHGRRRFRDGEGGPPGQRLKDARREIGKRLLEHLKETDRDRYDELMKMREDDDVRFQKELLEYGANLRRKMLERREQSPEALERLDEIERMEKQARELAEKYRDASKEEKAGLAAELKAIVGALFDAKLANQQEGMKRLEQKLEETKKQLAEWKELLEKRQAARDTIIERRIEALTGKGDHLEW